MLKKFKIENYFEFYSKNLFLKPVLETRRNKLKKNCFFFLVFWLKIFINN